MIVNGSGSMDSFNAENAFCKFLQKVNPDICSLLVNSGNLSYILSHNVSFALPNERYTQEIVQMYEMGSDDALNILHSLFLFGTFRSARDFSSKITSMNCKEFKVRQMGKAIELGCSDNSSNDSVIIEPTSTVIGDSKKSIPVWEIKSGRFPLTGIECSLEEKHETKTEKHSNSMRKKLAMTVENKFIAYAESKSGCNPYIKYTLSVLNFIIMRHGNMLTDILPRLHTHPVVTFYLLFEPFKTKDHLLSDELLSAWGESYIYRTQDLAQEYHDILNYIKGKTEEKKFKIFSQPEDFFMVVDSVRNTVRKECLKGPSAMVNEIRKSYDLLYKENKLGQLIDVLPQLGNVDQQLFILEYTNEIIKMFSTIDSTLYFDKCAYTEFQIFVRTKPGNSYSDELSYTSLKSYKSVYINAEKARGVRALTLLVNSSAFLLGGYELVLPERKETLSNGNELTTVIDLRKEGMKYLHRKYKKNNQLFDEFNAWWNEQQRLI
jgi:hypothetical protein